MNAAGVDRIYTLGLLCFAPWAERTVQVAPRNRSGPSRAPLCHRVAVFIKVLVILLGVYLDQPSVTEISRHPCVSVWSLPFKTEEIAVEICVLVVSNVFYLNGMSAVIDRTL